MRIYIVFKGKESRQDKTNPPPSGHIAEGELLNQGEYVV